MLNLPAFEEQSKKASISYGHRHYVSYRAGLVLQVLGLALLAVLYPLENPFYTAGIMLFEIGVLLSGIYLRVWLQSIKKIILTFVIIGIVLQITGYSAASEQYAGIMMIAGLGLVCAGASGMAAKEAYCFGYREGWLLALAGFPVVVLVNLLEKENHIFNSAGFSLLFLLLLSLTGKKLKQPLSACGAEALHDQIN